MSICVVQSSKLNWLSVATFASSSTLASTVLASLVSRGLILIKVAEYTVFGLSPFEVPFGLTTAELGSFSLASVEVTLTLGWTTNSALADLAWAETIFELAKVEFALVGLVSVEIAESAVFALTPFEVEFVLGAVVATEPTSFFLVSVGVILGLAVAGSASCVLFSCTTEDFSTLFTVSALTDWLPMPIVTKPKQTEQRPIVYLRKLNLCSISLLKNDFRLCILHFLVFSKNINSNTRGAS